MDAKRISIFSGHYGSGKTNIAINYALKLAKNFPEKQVCLSDLDIVNPYFRSKDSAEILIKNGVRLISSEFANSNVDLPALPSEVYSLTDDKNILGVIDVGGDDRGALALGRYSDKIKEENDYEMFFVINSHRPLTKDAKSTIEIMKEIENAASLKFTAIACNCNIGEQTTPEIVLDGMEYAKEVSNLSGLPIKMTVCNEKIYADLKEKVENLFAINLYVKQTWQK